MPRSYSHWTVHYLFNRSREKIYRSIHPELPWLTPQANKILENSLKKTDQGFEFGSGHSTLWFAKRVARLTSVEHQPDWYKKVKGWLDQAGLKNVNYLLQERTAQDGVEGENSEYARVLDSIENHSLDFILIDGTYRAACALRAIPKIKKGGMMIIDNANLYLPCQSHSPNSRSLEQDPASPLWVTFWDEVKSWRRVWTSNGVSDTAFFFHL